MSILDNLNNEQTMPVLKTEGAILVTAGAGSGKTRLLTHRIAYLIKEKNVAPYNILAITFTNKAAKEMKERVDKMLLSASEIWISTFHSLCVKILIRDIDRLGYTKTFSIYAEDEQKKIFSDIFQKLEIDEDVDKKTIKTHILRAKSNNISPKDYAQEVGYLPLSEKIIMAYELYEEKLRSSNALDFDDLLIKTFLLLKNYEDILSYYQNMFRYIHVDEFQDTSKIQYEIVKLLALKWKNIMVVGDEDQCIYGWRGANIENIQLFQKDFYPVDIFKLEQNYRSTKSIISVANNIISHNSERIKKVLWTDNISGSDVVFQTLENNWQEAEFVIKTISKYVREYGYSCGDIAILMRLNALSRDFESALNNAGLPYKVFGGFKFYERSEIKNIVAYLKILVNPLDEESLIRIINFPKRNIGETTIKKIKEAGKGKSLLETVLDIENTNLSQSTKTKVLAFKELYQNLLENINKPVVEFVEYLIDKVGFRDVYDKNIEEEYSKILNIEQFIQGVKEYQKNNKDATLSEYIQSVMLLTDIDEMESEENSVIVGTIHSVKGLEFKIVFVVGLEEGLMPITRSGDSTTDIEEERRLMYVATTRAKEQLFLTNAKQRFLYNKRQFQKPSRFLEEAEKTQEEQNEEKKETRNYQGNFKSYFSKMQQDLLKSQKVDYNLYTKGTKVFHSTFGVGEITDDSELKSNHSVVVTFNVLGAKKLSLEYTPLKIMKK